MSRVVYIDESQRGDRYLLAAMAARPEVVDSIRRDLRLCAPRGSGVTRRHFVKESDVDRRKLLAAYRSLSGAEHLVYETTTGRRGLEKRERCLDVMVTELLGGGISRLVLDNVEPCQQRRDRQVLARKLDGANVSYGHGPAHNRDPMLWVPDAIAWCAGRRDWRKRIADWVTIRSI